MQIVEHRVHRGRTAEIEARDDGTVTKVSAVVLEGKISNAILGCLQSKCMNLRFRSGTHMRFSLRFERAP